MSNFKVALYEPEIPQNVGAIIRTCACFSIDLLLIEPFGFVIQDRAFRRAKMDYNANINFYASFQHFRKQINGRIILFSPHSTFTLLQFEPQNNDILLFGRESNGIELTNAKYCDMIINIPINKNCRSLNVANSVALVVGFYLSKINWQHDDRYTNNSKLL